MNGTEKWADTCARVVSAVCGQLLDSKTKNKILTYMVDRKFIPGGRYLYSAGRSFHQVNNCFLFRAEDSREGWSDLAGKCSAGLLTGCGIGVDYSLIRHDGAAIKGTGGVCTGPISLMEIINETGRFIMQGEIGRASCR